MHPLIKELIARGPVVTDGAWGTELQARGLASGDFPDAWNLTHPERVEEVARAYVAAGSQVILTNTFGANRPRLGAHALADRVAEINRAGVEISRRAAGGRAKVFASIGPSGKLLMTGEMLSAARAAELGLINHVVPADQLDARVTEVAAKILANPRWAVRWTKTVANLPLKALAAQMSDAAVAYEALSNMTADRREAVAAFVAKRKPDFTGE